MTLPDRPAPECEDGAVETTEELPTEPPAKASRRVRWIIGAATAVGVGAAVGIAVLQSRSNDLGSGGLSNGSVRPWWT
jgi:hypothetical protein